MAPLLRLIALYCIQDEILIMESVSVYGDNLRWILAWR